MTNSTFAVSPRNKVLRLAKRGHYDRETVYGVVDSALICHVAYAIDGQPHALPTLHARDGDTLLLHGHGTNRTLLHTGDGQPVCIAVTHTDGIVLARSIFNHSINYRSATLYGKGRLVTDRDEKMDALYRFSEKLLPGRWDSVRPMNDQEFKATAVVAIDIEDAVAKIRSGDPVDDAEDISYPTWAGVIPVHTTFGVPVPDAHTPADMELPASITSFLAGQFTSNPD
jgi:nitroimidazol reductase NimA-like FMN-containing flavoprotein (pyridoxamine 5'-phosphate oxidase superfamily)